MHLLASEPQVRYVQLHHTAILNFPVSMGWVQYPQYLNNVRASPAVRVAVPAVTRLARVRGSPVQTMNTKRYVDFSSGIHSIDDVCWMRFGRQWPRI